ncbi:MAG: recombinase RecA [Candidatus Absconditabacteria bacterium]
MGTKNQVLEDALKHIEKEFGKGSIMRLGENSNLGQVNTFHSGSYVLDLILGGGYPEGRIIEIYGPESSGKTTLALHAIAEVQKMGEIAAFIDAEHALDPEYAKNLGVDTENLLLSQPDYGEQALQIAEELAKTGAVKLIVIDSVAAMVPRAEVEGDMGDSHMGLQARMMSQGLRKLTSILAKTATTVIFINQIRMKIGIMFGNPETTTGGNALKFFASQRLEIRRGEKIEESKEQIGYKGKVKIVKNKIAPPFKAGELVIKFNQGICSDIDLVEAGVILGSITRAGAFYTVGDNKVQGKDNLVKFLSEDEPKRKELENLVINTIKQIRTGKKPIPTGVDIDDEEVVQD